MDKQYTAKDLATLVGGRLEGNGERIVSGVNSLKMAAPEEATFLHSTKYAHVLDVSKGGVILVPDDVKAEPTETRTLIFCEDPNKGFTKVCALFAPAPIEYERNVHPMAFVHPTAKLGANVHVGASAVIDEYAEIADGAVICACAYVGKFVKIGEETIINPNASVMHRCIVGKKCIIHAGASIGADGFGFTPTFKGLVKVPQNGIVRIDDNVEIGANSTIDRARFGMTWIKKGVKIDNLVHIAHNVVVGESSALIGQCGIAGSAEIGRGVVVAAQAGVNGHITLADGSTVAGASAVQKSTLPGQTVFGTPAESQEDFIERHALPRKVRRLVQRIEKLEETIKTLEQKS